MSVCPQGTVWRNLNFWWIFSLPNIQSWIFKSFTDATAIAFSKTWIFYSFSRNAQGNTRGSLVLLNDCCHRAGGCFSSISKTIYALKIQLRITLILYVGLSVMLQRHNVNFCYKVVRFYQFIIHFICSGSNCHIYCIWILSSLFISRIFLICCRVRSICTKLCTFKKKSIYLRHWQDQADTL